MKKPNGIFSILDSTCIQPRGSDAVFTQNLFQVHGNSNVISPVTRAPSAAGAGRRGSQFDRMNGFKVKHYAGEVTYDAEVRYQPLKKPVMSTCFFSIRDFWSRMLTALILTRRASLQPANVILQHHSWIFLRAVEADVIPKIRWNLFPLAMCSATS